MPPADGNARALVPRPRALALRRLEREFLPAALEIVDTPASPLGRAIAFTVILFFAVAIVWASFGSVDVIATARGKIVPTSRIKVVQPFETGVVRAIHVQDGQAVKAGQVLIELDPTINTADRDRLQKELLSVQLEVARLKAAAKGDASAFVAPAGALPAQVELQSRLLANQLDEIQAKLASVDRQVVQADANRNAVSAAVDKLTRSTPLLRERVETKKRLSDLALGTRTQYLELQQDLVEHEAELQVQKARLAEATAALAAAQEQRRQTEAEFRHKTLGDLAQAEQKAASLGEELVKAQQHQDLQTLAAPVAGTVQQLSVHTVGGVVTPAQPLLVIVPAESRLEIEAMVENRDIGFVHPGQSAEVKIDTFNFTRYGLLHGEVVSVSQDAITRSKPRDKGNASDTAVEGESSEPSGQELVYSARISLERPEMDIDGRRVALAPGMAVTTEIKTGQRRVIEYLLSPLIRYKHEAIRER